MRNLIKKDIIVGLRTMGALIVLILGAQFILILGMNKEVCETITDEETLNTVLVSLIMYFPLMLMPMIGVFVSEAIVTEEKKERILQVLFANGVSITSIWRSRVIVVCSVAYIVSLLGIAISLIYIRIAYGLWLRFGLWEFWNTFILIPLITLAVINIICLISYVYKAAQSIVGMIPAIAYLIFMYLSSVQVKLFSSFNNLLVGGIILLIVACTIISCDYLVRKISREYLINVQS